MTIEIVRVPVLSDNYVWLVHEPVSKETAVVDPAVAEPVLEAARERGWKITQIWNTHWHPDHIGGNDAIKAATGCRVSGPAREQAKIATLDVSLDEGDHVRLGDVVGDVIDVPAHTAGHIAIHLPGEGAVFVGDTLFAMGCGRLFEGTAEQMWESLRRLRALPEATAVYCGHEYTQSNARFALTVEPGNPELQARADAIAERRAANLPTVPSTIGLERATNPFLRADLATVQAAVGLAGADPVTVFAELRRRKDSF